MRWTSLSPPAGDAERSSSSDSGSSSSAESRCTSEPAGIAPNGGAPGAPRGGGGPGGRGGASSSISSARSSPSGRSSSMGPPPWTRSGPSISRSMKSSRAIGRSFCSLDMGRSESSEIGAGTLDPARGVGRSASVSAMGRSLSSPAVADGSPRPAALEDWQVQIRFGGTVERRREIGAAGRFAKRRQVHVGERIEAGGARLALWRRQIGRAGIGEGVQIEWMGACLGRGQVHEIRAYEWGRQIDIIGRRGQIGSVATASPPRGRGVGRWAQCRLSSVCHAGASTRPAQLLLRPSRSNRRDEPESFRCIWGSASVARRQATGARPRRKPHYTTDN